MKNLIKVTLLLVVFVLAYSCETGKRNNYPGKPMIQDSKNIVAIEEVIGEPKDIESKSENTVHNTNEYNYLTDNPYQLASQHPLSTFSIDVDNASYSEIRQALSNGSLPNKDAVRIEEMINYFDYSYKQPEDDTPFSVYTEIAQAPWNTKHNLVMIGIKGKELNYDEVKPGNLVFLIDTSGSMGDRNKLPLLIKSFKILVKNLPENSRVAIVTYAGNAGLVLPSTSVDEKDKIYDALDDLESGGSTAGGAGIELAYEIAKQNYLKEGNNRVILATDGDFNVGVSSSSDMIRMIQEKKKSNVYLTILGFGMGNYKDGRMEEISNKGNGNYFYIDSQTEAKKIFEKDLLANMFTIAKDVKIQVEFNPKKVKGYRLIGYANRMLKAVDFNDDKIDAGELGAGHTVTAFYEVIPASSDEKIRSHDDLKYLKTVKATTNSDELMTLKLRYKPINSEKSKLITMPLDDSTKSWEKSSNDFKFAASVAGFGMQLRDSEYKGEMSLKLIRELANLEGIKNDAYKNEFITLIDKYEDLLK